MRGRVGGGAPAGNPGGAVGCEQDISLSFGPLSFRSLRNGALGQGVVSGSCWQGRQNSELHCGGEMSEGKVLVQSHTGSVTTSLLGSRAPLQKPWGYRRGVGGPLVDFQGQPKPREATLGSSTWTSSQRNTSANWKSQCRWFLLLKPRLDNGCHPPPHNPPTLLQTHPFMSQEGGN